MKKISAKKNLKIVKKGDFFPKGGLELSEISKRKISEPIKKFDHQKHWKGMPEFNQPGIIPVKVLTVNFLTKEDMLKFSKMVGQEITAKTRSIWFPVESPESAIDKRWSDKKKKK